MPWPRRTIMPPSTTVLYTTGPQVSTDGSQGVAVLWVWAASQGMASGNSLASAVRLAARPARGRQASAARLKGLAGRQVRCVTGH
jgi:hypothetical protein